MVEVVHCVLCDYALKTNHVGGLIWWEKEERCLWWASVLTIVIYCTHNPFEDTLTPPKAPSAPSAPPAPPPPPCWIDGPGQYRVFSFFFLWFIQFGSIWKPACLTNVWIIDWPHSRQMFVLIVWLLKMRLGGGTIVSHGGMFLVPSKGQ